MPADPARPLLGKAALVVGADSGIGLATAHAFSRAGARVVMAGLREKEGADHAAGIAGASFVRADVRDEADVAAMVAIAVERLGGLDIAFNNAGIEGPAGPVQDLRTEDFDALLAINLRGAWLGMKYQIPHLIARGGGAIVNTSSTAGVKAIPNVAIYTATKHAIIGLTKAAALELAPSGIRVNAIAPGPVDTGLLRRMVAGRQGTLESVKARTPLGRIADADEIAGTVTWLASDAAANLTGTVLFSDGGLTAT